MDAHVDRLSFQDHGNVPELEVMLYNTVNVLNATELFVLKQLISYYVNFTLIRNIIYTYVHAHN